jgi:uncharacterized membrane protein YgcG
VAVPDFFNFAGTNAFIFIDVAVEVADFAAVRDNPVLVVGSVEFHSVVGDPVSLIFNLKNKIFSCRAAFAGLIFRNYFSAAAVFKENCGSSGSSSGGSSGGSSCCRLGGGERWRGA